MSSLVNFFSENLLIIVITLAVIALLLLALRLRAAKKGKYKLEKDSSGLWRYNKETNFQRQLAYGKQLDKKNPKEKDTKEKKKDKKDERKPIAVINFTGDIKAKQHTAFAKLVDEVEINKDELSEVVVTVSSPGGMVPQYGHVFSQMERLRSLDIPLTACIDVIAASGGYLMSLPANRIIAAPFSMIGSVGVVAFVPNFRERLEKWNIKPRTFTAGKFKRTVNLTDDATPEEVAHFQDQLESIHELFVSVVTKYRPDVNIDEVVTGDHWTATESIKKNLGLIDEIGTANDYLLQKNKSFDLITISQKKGFLEDGLSMFFSSMFSQLESRIERVFAQRFQ